MPEHRSRRRGLAAAAASLMAALALSLGAGITPAVAAPASVPAGSGPGSWWPGPTASAPGGHVRGSTEPVPGSWRHADVFLGLPFAAAPVGDLRWEDPQPLEPWSGVRDATVAPPVCPQGDQGEEDCLYLNLYRPAGTTALSHLPVVVWAYGGGNTGGSANDIDARRFATQNNVIVVVPSYRLGALGFLNLAGPDGDGDITAGDFGVADLKAALSWAREGAGAFGGDSRNITLASQSSGATNACRLMVDPDAADLFDAVTLASDDCLHDVDTAEQAHARAAELAEQVGCADPAAPAQQILACLREVPAEELAAIGDIWNPVADVPAADLIADGQWNRVPVLLGTTRNEGRGFAAWYDFDHDEYVDWVTDLVGEEDAPRVLGVYPGTTAPDGTDRYAVNYAIADIMTDDGMRGCGGWTSLVLARALAPQTPTYYYQFNDPHAPFGDDPEGFDFGTPHGGDVQYLFPGDDTWDVFTPAQQRLSDSYSHYLGSFARFHRPLALGAPAWMPLSPHAPHQRYLELSPTGTRTHPIAEFEQAHHLDLWSTLPVIMDRG